MNDTLTYEIVIRGNASDRLLARLSDDFAIDTNGDGNTRLTGEVRDQSHLHGVINHFRALAIDIVSITPTSPSSSDPTNTERQ